MINRRHAIHGLHSRFADHLLRRTSISLEETDVTIKFILTRIPLALTFPKVSNIEERISAYHLFVYISPAQILQLFLRIYSFSSEFFNAAIRIRIIPIRANPPLLLLLFSSFRFREKFYVPLEETAKDKIVSRVLVSNFHGFARNPVVNSDPLFS